MMEDHVQIILATKSQHYAVPSYPISVPLSSSPNDLNKLLIQLIKESRDVPSDVEFVFLVQNEYLNTTLGQLLSEKQLASETLEVEYCEKQRAPFYSDQIKQDDLISSVKRLEDLVLTGGYDGTIQLWNVRNPTSIFAVTVEDKIKCVEWLSLGEEEATFVTGGFDQVARIWSWNMTTNKVSCVAICRGHSETVMTAAARFVARHEEHADFFATGSWDGMLKIWPSSTQSTDTQEEPGGIVHTRKSEHKTPTRIPRLTLAGHRETITRVCWNPTSSTDKSTQLISVSWDHSLRLWDCQISANEKAAGGSEIRCVVSSHAFNDADARPQGILTASSDNRVRIFDIRAPEALSSVGYHGHTGWLTSVAWAPHRADQFVTGSIDRSVRLWDTRNMKSSLYDLMGHTDIVTDVDWADPIGRMLHRSPASKQLIGAHYILSSSADGTVKIYEYQS